MMLQFKTVENPHIYVFGTGGTGGFALEYLTRLYAESSQRVTIELYDGDDVEAKNLKRQNFTVNDLDMNKAEALVKRLSQYILNPPTFITHNEYVTDADELEAEVLMNAEDDETVIFVLAVDNIATRRLINTVISNLEDNRTFTTICYQIFKVSLYATCEIVDESQD